jgi:hypothetical protein
MDGSGVGPSIWKLAGGIDIGPLRAQLDAHPEIWNRHTLRTRVYGEASPHNQIDDLWVRFRAWDEVIADPAHCCDQHKSVFYPEADLIPAVFPIITQLMKMTGAIELGGILITRVPAKKQVARHVDTGWHALHYRKVAVQIRGNQEQAFCFEDAELRPEPGEIYEFINQRPHWVLNGSNEARETLIVCVR